MPSQRILWPSGGSSAAYGTDTAFTTPGAVSASDGTYTGAQNVSNVSTIGEKYGNWGWDAIIPAGATITDVQLEFKYKGTRSSGTLVGHYFARIGGVDQTDHQDVQAATFSGGVVVGPTSIFADRAWTRADLLDGTFEMVVRATSANAWSSVGYDYIAVTVAWLAGSDPTPHRSRRLHYLGR